MQQHVSSVTTKGQVTIPIEVRRLLGVKPHDKVIFLVEAGQVRITRTAGVVARTAGALKSTSPALSAHEEARAVEDAMAEDADGGEAG